jgi:hypothetical protein
MRGDCTPARPSARWCRARSTSEPCSSARYRSSSPPPAAACRARRSEPAQREELWLTAAQSLLAIAVLIDHAERTGAALLIVLFFTQFAVGALLPHALRGKELLLL